MISNILLWGILLVLAIFLEAITCALVSIWFIPGLFVATVLACFKVPFWVQCLVAIILTIISFILTKPIAKKLKKTNPECQTDLEKMIGSKHRVIKETTNEFDVGQILIKDIEWSILSIDKTPLYVGDSVVIEKIEGNTLYCRKVVQN